MTLSVRLSHSFGDFDLDIAFDAPPGVTVLFGRSGSGKTTVINAVAGLLRPDRGHVSVDDLTLLDTATGTNLPPHRRQLGYIFQEGRLFPHLTVRGNLAYGRWFRRAPITNMGHVVEMLGLGDLLDRRPTALSGGEKQRVAIGRALLADPKLILADEPLSALDEARKAEILPYFERLRDEVSTPILYVTHSTAELARLATTVVALDAGRISQIGPAPAVLGDPGFAPTGVRAVGALLTATIRAHHADGLTELDAHGVPLFLPRVAQPVGHALRVRIPAQDVMLSLDAPERISALNVLPGTVQSIRSGDGPGAIVSLSTAAGPILSRITRRSVEALNLSPGTRCHAILKTVSIAPQDVGG